MKCNDLKCPLISVVIPVYNARPYLRECIESVINQSYRHLQILLVDDGSTDGSGAICDSYSEIDARIRVIHKNNEGLARARKTGISQAVGDYVSYVDADDWIDENAYDNILAKLEGDDADIIAYGMIEEYGDAAVTKANLIAEGYYNEEGMRDEIYPKMISMGHFFEFGILPNLCCKLARRGLLERAQFKVSDNVAFGEDADCAYQMLLLARSIKIIEYAPYHYRRRQDSMVAQEVDISPIRSLYGDLKRAFSVSGASEILMPQLYSYMLFVLLQKSAGRIMQCDAFARIFRGKKIVLYGAGGYGRELHRAIEKEASAEITLWADKRFEAYRGRGLSVSAPAEILNCEYDMVYIAVLDVHLCEEIMRDLVKMGVDEKKIRFVEGAGPYVEAIDAILEGNGA